MEGNVNIYNLIRQIAHELINQNENMTRAELAENLVKQGSVKGDSLEVSRLVWDAYNHFNRDNAIYHAFVSNNEKTSVIQEFSITACFDCGYTKEAFDYTRQTLGEVSKKLNDLDNMSSGWVSSQLQPVISSFMSFVQGSSGIEKVRAQGGQLYNSYSQLVDKYNDSRDDLRLTIGDFVTIRTEVADIFRRYSSELIDIFGEDIKIIEPDLFDFDSIEYLDTTSMLKAMQLQFDQLQRNCSTLLSEISDSFHDSLSGAMSDIQLAGKANRTIGLAMAGLQMLSHYFGAAERTNQIKMEFENLKGAVRHDEHQIKTDLARLWVIYKRIHDNFIPKAEKYFTYAASLMKNNLNTILDSLYSTPESHKLYEQRNFVLSKLKKCEAEIGDHQQSIAHYNESIEDMRNQLNLYEQPYLSAIQSRPTKPSIIYNLLTFGVAKSNYNRAMTEWFEQNGNIVHFYESAKLDHNIYVDDCNKQIRLINQKKHQLQLLRNQLKETNDSLLSVVRSSNEVKKRMQPHIKKMISTLILGKEILELRINSNLTRVVQISDYRNLSLPIDVEKRIDEFTDKLRNQFLIDDSRAASIADNLRGGGPLIEGGNMDTEALEQYNQSIAQQNEKIKDLSNTAIQNGLSCVESYLKLQAKRTKAAISEQMYQKEYDAIMSDFRSQIDDIQNESAYIRDLLIKINTATDDETRQAALLLLSESTGKNITDADIDDFIEGKKALQI